MSRETLISKLKEDLAHARVVTIAGPASALRPRTDFLISAAGDISRRLQKQGNGVCRGWLRDTVGSLKVKDRAILEAVAALPGVIATLNYDNLLEDATNRIAVTWQKQDKVHRRGRTRGRTPPPRRHLRRRRRRPRRPRHRRHHRPGPAHRHAR